jgi:hypothetical protein
VYSISRLEQRGAPALNMSSSKRRWASLARIGGLAVFLGSILAFLLWRHDPGAVAAFTHEEGIVERVSAGMWFIAAAWSAVVAVRDSEWRLEWSLGAVLLALLGSRELDMHVWLTGWSLDDLTKYWDPRISLHERLMVVGLFLVPAASVLLVFALRMGKIFWPAFWAGAVWTRDVVIWLFVAGSTLMLDKARHVWPLLGLGTRPIVVKVVEESLELGLGVYTILLLWPLWRQALVPEAGESIPRR